MKLPFSPKKRFGQHFLKNPETAERIADSILPLTRDLLEIGPGTGILTTHLQKKNFNLWINEIDFDAIRFLKENFNIGERIIEGDFLEVNIKDYLENEFSATGNLPYNISSQILFKLLHNRHQVVQIVVMLQKEVAQRIASVPGNRDYGILSVLLQAYYNIEYLFTLDENEFVPVPKIKSGVIRCVRARTKIDCNEKLFFTVVKTAFNQRRKTLRNSLKPLTTNEGLPYAHLRAEALTWQQFVELTNYIERNK